MAAIIRVISLPSRFAQASHRLALFLGRSARVQVDIQPEKTSLA
jgi:hypothetical protein